MTREGDVGAGLSDTGLPTDSVLFVVITIIDINGCGGRAWATLTVKRDRDKRQEREVQLQLINERIFSSK